MKNKILNIFAITFPAIFFTFSTAGAGERVKVFEMAESVVTIEFSAASTEMELGDLVIAQENPAKNILRAK